MSVSGMRWLGNQNRMEDGVEREMTLSTQGPPVAGHVLCAMSQE